MAPRSGESWAQQLAAFRTSPAAFLAGPAGESLAANLLRDLRSERLSEQTKASLLALTLEYPTQLWPDRPAAERAAAALLDLLPLLPGRASALRRPLLMAVTTVLVSGDALGPDSGASGRLLALLLRLAEGGPERRALRATACECLRELESCRPGLLAGRLGLLRALQGRESAGLLQAFSLLYGLALRNALRAGGVGAEGPTPGGAAEEAGARPGGRDRSPARGAAAPEDAKELRAALVQLLDASYLLTAPAQAALLGLLCQTLRRTRGQPPALFKPQLVRLLGTGRACLLHAVLGLKAAFGEALFTGQDEALLLRRLVAAAQHPSLPPPARLFHLHCLLHFPENRPLGPAGEEAAPVLLTPRLAAGLFPSLLQEPPALLARLGLLCLLCLEEAGDEGGLGAGGRTLGYLTGLLAGLRRAAAQPRAARATAALCFRATCLVARRFSARPRLLGELSGGLASLYRARPSLAPHFVDLLDQAGEALAGPLGAALQRAAMEGPGGPGALRWHLRILARVAGSHPPGPTLAFLRQAAGPGGDWGREQALLRVGRALLRAGGAAGSGLADLLRELARSLGDPDGRDRARLYYSLLTHLAGPKAGAALGPSPRAPTLRSSLAAESAGFAAALTVREEVRAPLRLSRAAPGDPGPEASRLRLRVEALEPVYALELRFRVLEPHLEPLAPVHLPHLRPGAPSPPLLLALRPRRPYPARLEVSALYATPAGLTCHAPLPPVHVAFADLFLPFAPPAPPEARAALFERLWASCLPEGAESRVWWPVGPAELEGFVAEHLGPFVVAATPPSCFLVAVRLPPASRLLLRVEGAGRTGARVALRTDDWGLLPHAGEYLRGLAAAA